MEREQKLSIVRIVISALMLIALKIFSPEGIWELVLYLVAYFIIGYEIIIDSVKGIFKGDFLDEDFLMTVASIGAFVIGEYTEGVAVLLFFTIGELFEDIAVDKSRENIEELMDIRPDYANLFVDGKMQRVEPGSVEIGGLIKVLPGEKLPIDGIVVEGSTKLDTSSITGEAEYRLCAEGDEVISGCINMGDEIGVKTTKAFEDSTVSKILELVEESEDRKARSENFITKFAKVYTPVVCILALVIAILPPTIIGLINGNWQYATWVSRALAFLVVSCPCALVVSIPLAFFGGIGGAGREGILVKGANFLEQLTKVRISVFDKTGTLTSGSIIKTNAKSALSSLKAHGIHKTVMLSGDKKDVAEKVGNEVGIDEIHYELLPEEKVAFVEEFMSKKKEKEVLMYVGDGINDAPSLMRADIGVAMGAFGTDAAMEAADVVLMDDNLDKLAKAIRISKHTLRIVYENIIFSIGVKLLCLVLCGLGICGMTVAVFADVGVLIICILNAIRALYVKRV